MPIPEALQAVVSHRRFWTDFFWETDANKDDYPGMDWIHVHFPVTTKYKVSLSLGSSMSYFALEFHPDTGSKRGVEVAHDDQAHWHPHVLRWEELDLICRAAAHNDPALGSHPGLPLLLLQRFAPICVGDDVAWIAGMLRDAYRSVVGDKGNGGFSDGEIRIMIEKKIDARDAMFEWHRDEESDFWWIGQPEEGDRTSARELYSMRCLDGARSRFPSREWADMLAVAERLIGPSQPPESDPKISTNKAEMVYIPRSKQSVRLELPLRGRTPGLKLSTNPKAVAVTIDHILKLLDLGTRAEVTGISSCRGPDGQFVVRSSSISVELYKDDLARGLQVIKEALWWATAPADGLRLTDGRYKPLPFDIEEDEARDYQPLGLYFQLGRVNPEDDRWMPFTAELDPSCQNGLKSNQNAEGSDVSGYWTVKTTDGGTLDFHFNHLDGTPGVVSGTLAFPKLSPMASEALYVFLGAHHLILLPAGIMASQAPVGKGGWNAHAIASASELHSILQDGPCNWWWDRLMEGLGDESKT
ncbi:hypothetical protein ACJ41O_006424 [Fusarium nematophilum]